MNINVQKIKKEEVLKLGKQLLQEDVVLNSLSLDFKYAQGSCASEIDEAVRWLNNSDETNLISIPAISPIKITWARSGQLAIACISDEAKARILKDLEK